MKCKFKANKIFVRLIGVVVLILVVWYLVPPNEKKVVDLLSSPGSFFLYIDSDYPEKRANLFLNQMFGTVSDLSWYNVCFSSNGVSYKNRDVVDNAKFAINLLPLNTNSLIGSAQQWTKNLLFYESDQPALEQVLDKVIQTSVFSNLDGSPACMSISSNERGFLYNGNIYLLERTLDKNTGKYLTKEIRLAMNDSDPIRLVSATLEIKTNNYALYAKRITLFLILVGFIVSIFKILSFVFQDWRSLFKK